MFFSSPLWLLGLLPWLGLTLWFLWGLRHRVDVPFIQFWKSPQPQIHAKRGLEWPPPGLACILAAMLLGLLAAAGPVLRLGNPPGPGVSIIVDRGISMSARGGQRYRDALDQAARTLQASLGDGTVQLSVVPGLTDRRTDRRNWARIARDMPPTAADTAPELAATAARKLAEGSTAVIVVTDRALNLADPRLVRLGPANPPVDFAITRAAVHAGQVMVTIRNESVRGDSPASQPAATATLVIRNDSVEAIRMAIDLPALGKSQDWFLDLPRPGMAIDVELLASDDIAADNRWPLVRQGAWPVIEPRMPLSPELRRMIESYSALRPPAPDSKRIAIAASTTELTPDELAVILRSGGRRTTGTAEVHAHPVTAHIGAWPPALEGDEAGWDPVVTIGGTLAVGVRSGPPRRVLVSMDLAPWAGTTDFVVFWSNVFDWIGAGQPTYASQAPGPLGSDYTALQPRDHLEPGRWPGVYRRGDGQLVAVHPGALAAFAHPTLNAPDVLRSLRDRQATGQAGVVTTPWLLILAAALALASALLWRRGE